jgi:hypothetical protein
LGVLGLALLGLGPASAQAEVLDANCPGPTNAGSTSFEAQTFTAVHTGALVRGEMFVAKTPGPDFQMQIFNAGPSGPTGGALGTTTIPDSAIGNVASPSPTGPSTPADGRFSPGVSVTAGQQYAIVLTRNTGGPLWLAKDRNGNPCPGNEFEPDGGGGWMVINPNFDYPFSTFVSPVSGPVPSNAFSLGKLKGRRLVVRVPGPGSLTLAQQPLAPGQGAAIQDFKVLRPFTIHAPAVGTVKLRIRLNKTGRKVLRSRGKLKRIAQVTYTPDGGTANTQPLKLKLRR